MGDDMKREMAGMADKGKAGARPDTAPAEPSAKDSVRACGDRVVPPGALPGADASAADEADRKVAVDASHRMPSVLAGLLAFGCVALVVACIGFVHPAAGGGWSIAWLLGDAEAPFVDKGGRAEGSGEDSGGATESDSVKGSESDGDEHAARGGGALVEPDVADSAPDGDASPSESDGGASSAAGDASSSTGGSASSGSSNGAAPAPEPDTVTVTVSVDSSAVDGLVSGGGTFTFERGATAYDALLACGLAVGSEYSAMGVYVYSIGGLAERQFGGGSGWNYAVNGATPGYSSGAYELSDGDVVSWFYKVD